jgi:hypothetical protein
MALGYLMALIAAVLAALVNRFREGLSWPLFVQRIRQFCAVNLFAFIGLFVGW